MEETAEKYRLKIFLVKDEYFNGDIRKESTTGIEQFECGEDVVYYKKNKGRDPKWFTNLFNQESLGIFVTGISGYFERIIEVKTGITKRFVMTFGGAEKLLNNICFDQTFGRRIALNIENGFFQIKRNKISTTQSKTKEDVTKIKKISDFDLEYGLDLVTSVIVQPKATSFIDTKVTGSSFVSFSKEISLETLNDVLIDCYNESEKKDYLTKYGWIEKISEIENNPTLISLIKAKAIEYYIEGNENFWLGAYEVLDWFNVESFEIFMSRKAESIYISSDIDLDQFKEELKKKNIVIQEFDDLKKFKVNINFDDGRVSENAWSIFDCVYCEIDIGDDSYVINGGHFYKIDKSYSNEINLKYKALTLESPLPENDKIQRESEYIKSVCNDKDYLYNCDCQFVPFDDNIEICDIYDSQSNTFIHVKKEGSASLLSHLFSQAKVSADIMLDNANYKNVCDVYKEKVGVDLPQFDKSKTSIVLAIISRKTKDDSGFINLSFFSKINMVLTVDTIRKMQYKDVKIMFIHSTVPLYNKKNQQD